MMKQAIEQAEELFDQYSESIDDNSFDFQRFANTSVVTRSQFIKCLTGAIQESQMNESFLMEIHNHIEQLPEDYDAGEALNHISNIIDNAVNK